MASRRKVYVEGPNGVGVPFTEVALTDGSAIRLYDTSGPGSDPSEGLPTLRRHWILERDDVEEYAGRAPTARDDGRSAARRVNAGNGQLERRHVHGRDAPTAAGQAGAHRHPAALRPAGRGHARRWSSWPCGRASTPKR